MCQIEDKEAKSAEMTVNIGWKDYRKAGASPTLFNDPDFPVGSVSRQGRHGQWESVPPEEESGTFVAWVASAEETKRMKPTDQAILGMVSESPGRNASEPSGGLDRNKNPEAEPSPYGRRQHDRPRADRGGLPLRRGG